jgi:hypothetical protein
MPSKLSRLLLGCSAAMALGAASLTAAPTAYLFDPTGGDYEALGIGTFTLDIGVALDDYAATSVSGGGAAFGTWSSVNFIAVAGQQPSLVISNLVNASFGFFLPAIGGGEINSDSQGDLEWANFLAGFPTFGISITPVTSSVPDGGPSFFLIGGVLGGLCLFARSRTPARNVRHRGRGNSSGLRGGEVTRPPILTSSLLTDTAN